VKTTAKWRAHPHIRCQLHPQDWDRSGTLSKREFAVMYAGLQADKAKLGAQGLAQSVCHALDRCGAGGGGGGGRLLALALIDGGGVLVGWCCLLVEALQGGGLQANKLRWIWVEPCFFCGLCKTFFPQNSCQKHVLTKNTYTSPYTTQTARSDGDGKIGSTELKKLVATTPLAKLADAIPDGKDVDYKAVFKPATEKADA
jgi:hypothetical protein